MANTLTDLQRKELADAYRKKLKKVLTDADVMETKAVKTALKLTLECQKQVAAELINIPVTNWKSAHLKRILGDLNKAVDEYTDKLGIKLSKDQQAFAKTADKIAFGAAPDEWPGYVHISTKLPILMQGLSADLVVGLNAEVKLWISQEIRLAMLKGESPYEVMAKLGRNITTKGTRFHSAAYRAELITRTEMARAHSLQAEASLEAAVKLIPDLQEVWIANVGACPLCAELDGQTWNIGEAPDTPPLHPNCYCRIAGYKKEWFD